MSPFAPLRRQRGAASAAIAMVLVFLLLAAASAVMNLSGSAVIDAAANEQQISALFVAESGVERMQGTIWQAARTNGYTDATCTGLTSLAAANLGQGTFQYRGAFQFLSATSTPSTCGGSILNPNCTGCTVTVKGTIGSYSRTIRALLSLTNNQGIEGNASQFTLNLNTSANNAAAFTNLAYRAKAGGGSSAMIGSCTNTGGSCLITSTSVSGWNLNNTGTNNVSGMGVYASVPTAGTYSITDTLVDNSNNPAARNYVQTGALFYPLSGGSVGFVGSFGRDSGSNKTIGTSTTTGSLPTTWNCAAPTNATGYGGTASASNAAGANTLVYGFSSWPASAANQLNHMTLGIQPLSQILRMTGTQGDNLYSQIWYSYNPAYYPTGATGATNGANFTGTIGATFSGTITGAGATKTLTITSGVTAPAILTIGDTITNNGGTTVYGTLGSLISGTLGATGSTYNIVTASTVATATTLWAKSNVLRLATAPSSGVLTLGDSITNSGGATTYGTLGTLRSGTWGAAGSTYNLTGAPQLVASSSLESVGTTITLSGTISGANSTPSTGTALAVSSGTGTFDSSTFTGSISGTTLTVTSCSNGSPANGDALFGVNVRPNTRITGPLATGSACNGTYPVSTSQTAASDTILARAAVVSVTSANSYSVSRKPTTRLASSALLCGGVCPFFFDNTGSNTNFTLTNITSGDDWASGFACLSGVDPAQIVILGNLTAKKTSWSEPIQ